MKKFNKHSLIVPILLCTLLVGLESCQSSAEEQASQEEQMLAQQQMAAQARTFLTLKKSSVVVRNDYPARIEGKVSVDIRPQAEGYLQHIYVDEGAYVKAGQSLFKIADAPYREQLHTAEASLKASQAELERARMEVDKFKELSENKVTSDFQLRTAKAAYETAQANVSVQQAAVATAKINLNFTLVKAPVSGLIGRIPKRIGNLVSRSDAEAMTTLSDISQVYAYFSMTEQNFLQLNRSADQSITQTIKKMPAVELILADGKPYDKPGKIQMVDGKFDTGTSSISIRAIFDNPRSLLRSGNTGRIVLPETRQNVILVPIQATTDLQDKLFVFRVGKDKKLERIAIEVSGKSGDNYILASGLNEGDRIVAKDVAMITEGEAVQ